MSRDRLTPEERAAVARYDGEVTRVERRPRPTPKPTHTEADYARAASKAPAARAVPETMSVRQALEWAFGTECAYFDVDEIGASAGAGHRAIGTEAIIEQRFQLGRVAIDRSPGRSEPAEDAELIASVVRATLPFREAVWVADLARAGITPDAMVDAVPRIEPVEWVAGRPDGSGRSWWGKREDARALGAQGWLPQPRRNRKGAIVYDAVQYTPCTWSPTPRQIATAHRRYLDWYGHLFDLRYAIRAAGPRWFEVTDDMPPMTPWR